jgi:hypothetical protein
MMTRSTIAIVFALQLLASPVMAQATTEKDSNAHHYQGGPQTGVPHSAKHTKPSAVKGKASGGHHYSGGPKTESHHMGEKN